jgi:hypothetical protein
LERLGAEDLAEAAVWMLEQPERISMKGEDVIPLAMALKQFDANLLFQVTNLAQGRLRNIQASGSPPDIFLLRNNSEVAKVAKFHTCYLYRKGIRKQQT